MLILSHFSISFLMLVGEGEAGRRQSTFTHFTGSALRLYRPCRTRCYITNELFRCFTHELKLFSRVNRAVATICFSWPFSFINQFLWPCCHGITIFVFVCRASSRRGRSPLASVSDSALQKKTGVFIHIPSVKPVCVCVCGY